MARTFVLGDVHGVHGALVQVLESSGLNPEEDTLICLGDVPDRNPLVSECFTELLKIRNLIYIMGNHDLWLLQWFKNGETDDLWMDQGARYSIASYRKHPPELQESLIRDHMELLENAPTHYIDADNRLFVHGGFKPGGRFNKQAKVKIEKSVLLWDRDLLATADMWHRRFPERSFGAFNEIFIGHTPTFDMDPSLKPVHRLNVWALDQGVGYDGKLTLMDVNTKEYWQSAPNKVHSSKGFDTALT
jgi:serine/threonine protein phosphatase 1